MFMRWWSPITHGSSEGSDNPAHTCNLTRALAACTYIVWTYIKALAKL